MNERLAELDRRKGYLIARCAQEREELARCCDKFHALIKISTAVTAIVHTLKSHPEILLAISGLFARGRTIRLGWAGRAARRVLILWPVLRALGSRWAERGSRR